MGVTGGFSTDEVQANIRDANNAIIDPATEQRQVTLMSGVSAILDELNLKATSTNQEELITGVESIQDSIEENGIPSIGSNGHPIAQKCDDSCGDGLNETLTYDTNMEAVFGSRSLVNGDRVKVDVGASTYREVHGTNAKANDAVMLDCVGLNSVMFVLAGTWSGTQTFQVSMNGQDYISIICHRIDSASTMSASITSNATMRASITNYKYFRIACTSYSSGACKAHIVGSSNSLDGIPSFIVGNQSAMIKQRATLNDTETSDAGIREVFSPLEYWQVNKFYHVGDVVLYNNNLYQCLTDHSGSTSGGEPRNSTSNWRVDPRPSRSLVRTSTISKSDAPRLSVEGYYEKERLALQEESHMMQYNAMLCDLEYKDMMLSIAQDNGLNQGYRNVLTLPHQLTLVM